MEPKVKEIIEKSGNSFHVRVVKKLRELGWTVMVSPYYSDNFTDKPREIDVITEKKFPVYDFRDFLGTLNVRLFIECKYINGKTVFWFDDKDKNRAYERIMSDTGLDHPNRNTNILRHHYSSDIAVAKLFSSERSPGEENELINKAINQNLNALVYYRNRGDIIIENPNQQNQVLQRVPYPLIVVNSFENFFRISMTGNGEEVEQITEPFQLEVNYAYIDGAKGAKNEYFLIDVVSIEKLPEFFIALEENDVAVITENLSWQERQNQRQMESGNNSISYL